MHVCTGITHISKFEFVFAFLPHIYMPQIFHVAEAGKYDLNASGMCKAIVLSLIILPIVLFTMYLTTFLSLDKLSGQFKTCLVV